MTLTKPSYSFAMQSVRSSNAFRSSGVHQFARLPSASNLLPWSSKPCVYSWPITTPIPPKFTASSIARSKNGGCRMPAGNTISLFAEL